MKKQIVSLLGVLLVSGSLQAIRVKHVEQSGGNCVIHDRTSCNDQNFTSTKNSTLNDFARAPLKKSFFIKSNFTGQLDHYFDFKGADLTGAQFSNSKLKYVDLSGSKFERADFFEADLKHVNLNRIVGSYINFQRSVLEHISWDGARVWGSDFSWVKGEDWSANDAEMHDALFREAKLKKTDFINADLQQADFYKAKIEDSKLFGVELDGASFRCARLDNVTFKQVKLNQVDLIGADLSGSHLTGADQRLLEGHYCFTVNPQGQTMSSATEECKEIFKRLGVSFSEHAPRPDNLEEVICPKLPKASFLDRF